MALRALHSHRAGRGYHYGGLEAVQKQAAHPAPHSDEQPDLFNLRELRPQYGAVHVQEQVRRGGEFGVP